VGVVFYEFPDEVESGIDENALKTLFPDELFLADQNVFMIYPFNFRMFLPV